MNHTLPRWMDLGLLPALNLAMALVGASVVVWAIGLEPLEVIGLLVKGAWGSASGISYTLYYSTTFVFTGLAVFVPYLGFGLGLVLGLVAAALQFQDLTGLLLVLAVFGAGQLLESLWLTPKLLGERIGLHPIAVIFSLMAFGHLLGFVGVLMALPVSAVLLVALRRLRLAYTESPLYRGRPAAAPPGATTPPAPATAAQPPLPPEPPAPTPPSA